MVFNAILWQSQEKIAFKMGLCIRNYRNLLQYSIVAELNSNFELSDVSIIAENLLLHVFSTKLRHTQQMSEMFQFQIH